jgi:hypothetical protein
MAMKGIANVAGAALGAGQMIAGAIQSRKADKMLPTAATASEQRLVEQMKQMRKALLTNKTFAQDAQASRNNKMFLGKLFSAGGRNIGALSAQMGETQANIAAQNQAQAANLAGQEVEATRFNANVGRDFKGLLSARKSAKAEQLKQSGGMNLGASLGLENNIEQDGQPKSTFFSRLFKKKKKMI